MVILHENKLLKNGLKYICKYVTYWIKLTYKLLYVKTNHRMNNNQPSARAKCKCSRRMTIGEEKAGYGIFTYICPNCSYFKNIGVYSIEQYNNWLKK